MAEPQWERLLVVDSHVVIGVPKLTRSRFRTSLYRSLGRPNLVATLPIRESSSASRSGCWRWWIQGMQIHQLCWCLNLCHQDWQDSFCSYLLICMNIPGHSILIRTNSNSAHHPSTRLVIKIHPCSVSALYIHPLYVIITTFTIFLSYVLIYAYLLHLFVIL